ncbi:Heat shock 70 kDa protein 12B [Homo sapiens] [Rhizoctonia solani]|uniref:Heat shock 70 kDa protein 12B [Homo sapiens] n=1 Tax=Rhizoctonia solani TaxID=456999 RepID=A0A0K6G7G4_9AGAM|nr:Heat shock 70 kDa protein 12B [Homo sapiens] [Rhizoctonia solani]
MEHTSGLKWKERTKIVIGIDIGTTQSAVAIGLLEQGVEVGKALHTVTEWPGQHVKQSKIPTAIWYDTSRQVPQAMSFGAETMSFEIEEKALKQKWQLVQNFKLHMHPEELRTRENLDMDLLPTHLPLEQVYSDFLRYLFANAENYFKDRIVRGNALWQRHREEMEFVIAHPNAWSTTQQAFLRKVAIEAGLVNKNNARKRVRFVTEAEASVHYCLYNSNLMHHLQPGTNFAVCDAGGSTTDSTLYSVASTLPLFKIEEKSVPGCVQAGGIFIDRSARIYMQTLLGKAGLSIDDVKQYCDEGIKDFEAHAKRSLGNGDKEYFINLGNSHFSDSDAHVRRGRMAVSSADMKSFFDAHIKKIFDNVDKLIKGVNVSDILLVGGFGDSRYLRDEFKKRYNQRGCQVTLMDTSRPTSKAVADGAIVWSYSQAVVSRRPRSTFGTTCATIRDPGNPEHSGRGFYLGLDGREHIAGKWETIALQGVPIQVTSVNRSSFTRSYSTSAPYLGDFHSTIEAYAGENPPYWSRSRNGTLNPGFRKECKVTANLQKLSGALEMKVGKGGKIYWELGFSLCIRYGGVELEGFIEWEEDGETREGPITIVPDEPIGE